jgi:hypothetical protein
VRGIASCAERTVCTGLVAVVSALLFVLSCCGNRLRFGALGRIVVVLGYELDFGNEHIDSQTDGKVRAGKVGNIW